jgi:hypothetical protein
MQIETLGDRPGPPHARTVVPHHVGKHDAQPWTAPRPG